jgi:hypothetical protein
MNLIRTILVLLIFSSPAFAQSLPDLEKDYYTTLAGLKQQQSKLDSLNARLARSASEIDAEKSRAEVEQDKLRQLMARALTMTKEIESQQKSFNGIQTSLTEKRDALNEIYTAMIDSLRAVEQSGHFTGNEQELQNQIRAAVEKRLMISPAIQSLRFDPHKIQSLRLEDAENEFEKEIFEDYLQNALIEVSEKLTSLNETKVEWQDILLLQEKTDEFLQDVDTEGIIGLLPSSQQTRTGDLDAESSFSDKNNVMSIQIQAYSSLANQLELLETSPPGKATSSDLAGKNRNLSIREYLNLLDQVDEQLRRYRSILIQKLGQSE